MSGNLVWCFLSSTWFGSSAIKTPTFSTLSPKNVRSNLVYIFVGICPSLATVNLNKQWASAFSPVAGLIFGSICWSKYDCWSSVTSLLESNKDGIWIPWALMHTLGHLATAHCIISILVSAEMEAFLNCIIKQFSSWLWWGPLTFSPLGWSMTKGGLHFPVSLVASQAVCSQRPAFY